ncbi:MAG: RidA family protein [Streptococcaceae bacterium]|jgi:2-iminobutanoate/2-iminopropanoate deaminase|nr:RidA family protein [Streptococcaceae bacterium]
MEVVQTNFAPQAIGPYVQGKIVNGLLFASGQIPLSAETGEIVGKTIEEQTTQVLKNVEAILIAAGTNFDNVVKTTCFLSNMDNFVAFNEVYRKSFRGDFPARSAVEVAKLPRDVLIEIEVIAAV